MNITAQHRWTHAARVAPGFLPRPCAFQQRSCACWAGGGPGRHHQQQQNRQYDLLGLSNLCVDVVVDVESLPGSDEASRLQLLHQVRPTGASTGAHTTAVLCGGWV